MRKVDYRKAILDGLQTLSNRNKRGPRPSSAGACPKKIYWDWVGAESKEAERSLLSPLVGTALHREIEKAITTNNPRWANEVSVEIDCNGFSIRGSADLVHMTPCGSPELTVDLKFATTKSWNNVNKKQKAKAEHVAQVNLYSWALGTPSFHIVYVDVSGFLGYRTVGYEGLTPESRKLRIQTYAHQTSESMALETIGKFENVYAHAVAGTEFPTPYFEPRPFPCEWCGYYGLCWSKSESMEV